MGGEYIGANYNLAKTEADKIDAQIIETLKSGHSFRVEAGAGSGKTSIGGKRTSKKINLLTAVQNDPFHSFMK